MVTEESILGLVVLLPRGTEPSVMGVDLLIVLVAVITGITTLAIFRRSRLLWRLIVSFLFVGASVGTILMLRPSVARMHDADPRVIMQHRARQIVLAMHNYSANHNSRLPPAVLYSKEGQALHSWRVLLLPYLGEEDLYNQFRLDEPWNSPHNLALLDHMPEAYAAIERDDGSVKPCTTYFQVFVGTGTAFGGPEGLPLTVGFPNGTANTILIVEAGEAVPWTMPSDLRYSRDSPLPLLGGVFTGEGRFRDFGPNRIKGFHVGMADGSVRFLQPNISEVTLRALIARD